MGGRRLFVSMCEGERRGRKRKRESESEERRRETQENMLRMCKQEVYYEKYRERAKGREREDERDREGPEAHGHACRSRRWTLPLKSLAIFRVSTGVSGCMLQ